MERINSFSALLKRSSKMDIYILTAFGFYIGCTRRDLKLSLGKQYCKCSFGIEVTNAIFIKKIYWK